MTIGKQRDTRLPESSSALQFMFDGMEVRIHKLMEENWELRLALENVLNEIPESMVDIYLDEHMKYARHLLKYIKDEADKKAVVYEATPVTKGIDEDDGA